MKSAKRAKLACFVLGAFLTAASYAQTADTTRRPDSPQPNQTGTAAQAPKVEDDRLASAAPGPLIRNIAYDQKRIWTSPFKAKIEDLNWIVPMLGLTAGLINADSELSSRIDSTGSFARHGSTISNAGVAAMVGGGAGFRGGGFRGAHCPG